MFQHDSDAKHTVNAVNAYMDRYHRSYTQKKLYLLLSTLFFSVLLHNI